VVPDTAARSICGCQYNNVRFRVFVDSGRVKLKAKVVLPSNEILSNLPIVDQEWRNFLYEFTKQYPRTPAPSDFESFLNGSIRARLMKSAHSFLRIGLARAMANEEKCWLMLDSLFPHPDASWLDAL
jgi:hypothetical protein